MSRPSSPRAPAGTPSPSGEASALAEGACAVCGTVADGARCDHCGAARRAGPYRIVGLLGQSERGRMYVAQGASGPRVALKELLFATVPSVEQLEAFEREGALLRTLSHPRIPRFLETFRDGEGVHTRLYLAQELVPGRSLQELLDTTRFSEADARDIATQVLEVLEYLHGLRPRVLHRDLKPSNLIRHPDGRLFVVDFGAARELARGVTHSATLVGTFGYMPPEQLGGTVEESSDVYALGATLIHLLSRRAPADLFRPGRELDFQAALRVSPALEGFLQKSVRLRPEERFRSAHEALQALRSAVPVRPVPQAVPAPPPPAAPRPAAKPSAAMSPFAWLLTGLVVAGMVLAMLASMRRPPVASVRVGRMDHGFVYKSHDVELHSIRQTDGEDLDPMDKRRLEEDEKVLVVNVLIKPLPGATPADALTPSELADLVRIRGGMGRNWEWERAQWLIHSGLPERRRMELLFVVKKSQEDFTFYCEDGTELVPSWRH